MRRVYDKEFKLNAVKLYESSGMTVKDVEKELGITPGCFTHWKKEFKDKNDCAFPGNGNINNRDKEFLKLKRELAIVKEERDILKKALGIFSKTPL